MPASPSSAAQAARLAVAARLRDIMKNAGLTSRAIAHAVGWDESKCSRLLHGRTPPSDADIRAWCSACGAEDQIPDLIAASRAAEGMYVEWKRQHGGIKGIQEARRTLYEQTSLFRFYCATFIPWPLQTPDYARAVVGAFARFHGTEGDLEAAVAARMDRHQLLHHGGHRFAMLIEESVLYDRIADDEAMATQLVALLQGMSIPSVSLGVIPRSAPRTLWTMETFSVYDETRVFIELLTAGVTITQPSEIATYVRAFAQLADHAVHGQRARAIIAAAIQALH
ncbi:helix-turn-helix domain-containing protein [Streptosporangiaceae bacterium NEAU-GS5]|nr:helix-turn-helix domain-containing protein [Streptosporangiaceae bacterium NEAU-GS5]